MPKELANDRYRRALGKRIRIARENAGFSQEDLGDALKRSWGEVHLWEEGLNKPHSLQQIAAVLQTSATWLRGGKGKPPTKKPDPENSYRSNMAAHMQRLVSSGKFDKIVTPRSRKLIRNGDLDDEVKRRAKKLKG